MVNSFAPATQTWTLEVDPDTADLVVTLIDSYSQRRAQFSVPAHAVRGLRDALTDAIDGNPEQFPDRLIRHEFIPAGARRL